MVRVAQPAVAVVPGALASRRLGNRSRHRRDDGAGVFVDVQLQGDGGADHRVLPFERDGERAHPFPPVGGRLFQEAASHVRDGALDGLVRAEEQRDGVFQKERGLLHGRGDGGVRSQPQHEVRAHVADMVRPAGDFRAITAVVVSGADPHPNAGVAGHPLDVPDQHHRAEHAPVLAEAGSEVRDLDASAGSVVQPGGEDRSVDEVLLLALHEIDQLHREEAEALFPAAVSE